MSKMEALLEQACQAGVLLAPVWLVYKVALFALS